MSDALNAIEKVTYDSGEFIFFEGDVENHFFIVESGTVNIHTKDMTGKKILITVINPGDSFGEFALISKCPRSATAQAATPVVLVKVSEEGFQELLAEIPTWAECMMKSFVERLQNMTEKIRELEQSAAK
jgi:CRP-like cAMP-binding protein